METRWSERWMAHRGLVRGGETASRPLRREERAEALLALAQDLQGILVPAPPRAAFRSRLHGELVQQANAKRAGVPQVSRRGKLWLVVVAALGSAASVAGLIVALVVRSRHDRAPHAA
jgi:hypothetical protein